MIERRGCKCVVKTEGFWAVLLSPILIPEVRLRVKLFSLENAVLWPGDCHVNTLASNDSGGSYLMEEAAGSWGTIRSGLLLLKCLWAIHLVFIQLQLCARRYDWCWVSACDKLAFFYHKSLCFCAQEPSSPAQSWLWGVASASGTVPRKVCC